MTIPLQFFQVAATSIPTLLIAVAVGAKTGEALVVGMGDSKFQKVQTFTFLLLFTLSIVVGEIAALLALVHGHGSKGACFWAANGIFMALVFVFRPFYLPFTEKISPRMGKAVLGFLFTGGYVIALEIFWYQI